MTQRYPIAPYPEGWYRVAWSRDLRPRAVLPLRWFGRDFVLYRGESGRAHVLDAFCPHVGAHLGHGGRVEGETIACPFHGWRLDASGSCVLVPLAKKVPPRARVQTWPVAEVSGAILLYMHPEDRPPRWTPAPLPGWDDPAWTRPEILRPWRVRTHVQEFGENGVDLGHAVVLHDHITRAAETLSVESDGPVFHHRSKHHYRVFAALEWLGKRVEGTLETRIDGFGRVAAHALVDAGIQVEHRIVFYPTPIDEEWVELHAAVTLRRHDSRVLTHLLHRKSVYEARKTIDQDAPIWSNKRYTPRPLLVEGEHAMGHYRRWARQFYPAEPQLATGSSH
jgi:phenylpropionate dioxygenase-like ring-hydroxylating dioxygenase large terminal subunit